MRLIAIADTHWMFKGLQIPKCDILLHAGDLEVKDYKDAKKFGDWWNNLEADTKVLCPGNHDFLYEKARVIAESYLDNTIVLVNEIAVVKGLTIAGVPHSLKFMHWVYGEPEETIGRYFTCINNNVDIILSHGPVFGIHDDLGLKYGNIGSKTLLKIISDLDDSKKRLFIHGHRHFNKEFPITHTKLKNIDIHNVSLSDDNYDIVRDPLIIEI